MPVCWVSLGLVLLVVVVRVAIGIRREWRLFRDDEQRGRITW